MTLAACTPAEQESAIATATAIAQTGNPLVPVVVTINESFGVGDAPAPVGPAGVVTNESLTVSDDPYVLGPLVFTVSETFSVGDAPIPIGPAVVMMNESFSLSDSPSFTPPTDAIFNDDVSIAESVVVEVASGSPPKFDVPGDDAGIDTKVGAEVVLVVKFSDKDAKDTHTGTIDWGDGKAEPAKVEQVQRFIGGNHTYHAEGTYKVTITITDSSGLSDTATTEVRVQACPTRGQRRRKGR